MIKKRVLILSSYPIVQPIHGGQKRARALYEFYQDLFTEVKYVGVFNRESFVDFAETDLPVAQPKIIKDINEHPHLGDIITGEAIYSDTHVRSPLAELILTYRPDIIQIEQVYTYLGLSKLLKDLGVQPLLVYSSHNVEYHMKKNIYKEVGIDASQASRAVATIRKAEVDLLKKANLVISVSKSDAEVFKNLGAKHVTVIPNGINKTIITKDARSHWETFKSDRQIDKMAVFVGSAHPPNWVGFLEMIGLDLSFVPKDNRLIMAGGISHYFNNQYDRKTYKKLWQSLETTGNLTEPSLAGLLATADVLLLPITSGGGSNLKTAEAILSGKKIVATSYAFRGFEKYKHLSNIFIADAPSDFKAAIIKALEAPQKKRSQADIALSRTVSWSFCLQPLSGAMKTLVIRTAARTVYLSVRHTLGTIFRMFGMRK